MKDVQASHDERNIAIQKVGVKNLSYPITVLDRTNKTQRTIASIDLFADLPHHFKGTHMSRFIEVFNQHQDRISMKDFLVMLEEIRQALDAEDAFGTARFPFFMEKAAPVSGQKSFLKYDCCFDGSSRRGEQEFFVSVEVPVHTLCPCSKEISSYGAHNQRGKVTVKAKAGPVFFWIEDLVELIESCASAGIYTLLKREDEKYITERAYENPVFVEDLVREVTQKIEAWGKFPWFSVSAENQESIHNHEAYAYLERTAKVQGI